MNLSCIIGENWNSRFQHLLDLSETTLEDRIYKYSCLSSLNNDFVNTSTLYAKAIISEYFVHSKDKTILDRSDFIGGIAGGKKYLWRGILFKLASGDSNPWNGNDEAAAKGAGHELKSTIHYFSVSSLNSSTNAQHIRYPLMSLIDYCGFRMICQAYLPLNSGKSSLIYGSKDAGLHIVKSNPTFNTCMENCGKLLNLKPHLVGRNKNEMVELCSAVDVEGHWGSDGLFYLLDLQRAFPPESYLPTKHLHTIIPCGVKVKLIIPNANTIHSKLEVEGIILKAFMIVGPTDEYTENYFELDKYNPPTITNPVLLVYDVIVINASVTPPKVQILKKVPANEIIYHNVTIFHRLLR